ncbi:unnamed protein product [Microthlaspi erraticum]|uniref:3-hydroxyisobutyryl-CoA hydrolase n=1 Tax=Microthlaspi erraticum TaxID=1685480 RepID=A0A6D2IWC8_9BRAS|nr:unnamed protein product [Microthlaspi erraticum]
MNTASNWIVRRVETPKLLRTPILSPHERNCFSWPTLAISKSTQLDTSQSISKVSLVNGISMGGGASLKVPMKFSVVTEKTVFATPEASIGFHTDCGFSYIHSRLPGHLGEFLALTGARLNGKELVATGMATHFVPSAKLADLEARLVNLDSGDAEVVRSTIEEFSEKINLNEDSILNNKQSIINECFSKESVKQIIQAFEAEGSKEGNEWIAPVIKGLKRSSPTGLNITLHSIREGRKQTLSDCLKKEFRLTVNILRNTISPDVYEGIRALTIDKDNSPKWNPATLDEVDDEKINLVFKPLEDDIELHIPETEENSSHSVQRGLQMRVCSSLCVEEQDYMGRIKELQELLDQVRTIVKPDCSQDVLKAALSVLASVHNIEL